MSSPVIGHTALCVSNLERSVKFYSELFDLKPVSEWAREEDGLSAAVLGDTSGFQLEIVQSLSATRLPTDSFTELGFTKFGLRHVALKVSSVDSYHQKALDLGAKELMAPRAGKAYARISFFEDLDGAQIELIEPK
jgi:catechol 2,3-dioxygenase-like lactoylglutathione lyase family enzyme